MIDDLKPYPEYKDSGQPWLGMIPRHWEARRLRQLIIGRLVYGANAAAEFKNPEWPRYIRITDFRTNGSLKSETFRSLPPEIAQDYMVVPGDILFARSGATVGKAFLVSRGTGSACHAGYLIRARPNTKVIAPRYLFAFTQSGAFASWKDSTFNTATIQNIGADKYANLYVPISPPDEQTAIVRFLDHANARIEQAVRAKRKLISLLNEQKQAIIHRAVTRGLDPGVKFKPSGIPWLGDVPDHWEVRRNSYLFDERNERGRFGLPILVVSLRTGVTEGSDIDEDGREKRLIADVTRYKFADKDDIAYNMMRMWQGAVGVVPVPGMVSPAYVVAKPRPGVHSAYFDNLFHTNDCKNEVNRHSRGIVTDRNRLYWDQFKHLFFPLPPYSEQQAITAWIQNETSTLNAAIVRTEREIALIREYRTTLTAEVVTGKVDVREAAKRLPSEAEELPPTGDLPDDEIEEEDSEAAE